MIPLIQTPWESDVWQRELAGAYRTPGALCEYLGLSDTLALEPAQVGEFSMLVPRGFAARMVQGDAQDPLLRQVLPSLQEHETVDTFVSDPLQEVGQFSKAPGVIHKYSGRALLIVTAGCAVHCRYCFRRHFPYADHRPREIERALTYIQQDRSITEVILSGGDPLLLSDDAFAALTRNIAAIDHVRRLRVHTRLPIVLPERITAALLATFESTRLQTVLVAHANHVNELDQNTRRAFGCLKASGVTLLNQSVLLAGVNNRANTQIALCEQLFAQGVLPYYLHMPDRVAGTHQFYVSRTQATAIYRAMQATLPGYLLPRLVQEVPGEAAKQLVHF
jgi:EF-P beta-lysylation protein EpmB